MAMTSNSLADPQPQLQQGNGGEGQGSVQDWRKGKTWEEKLEYLFENAVDDEGFGLRKDVTFVVGPDREHIAAHRFVVFTSSRVLEKMMYEPAGNRGPSEIILILQDEDPTSFRLLLKYFYCKKLPEGSDEAFSNVLKLYKVAKKFEVHDICDAICANVGRLISEDDALIMLDGAVMTDTEPLKSMALDFVARRALKLLGNEAALDISRDTLAALFACDNLDLDELLVFNFALKWAERLFRRKRQLAGLNGDEKLTGKVIREELGEALYQIRFPLMKLGEFRKLTRVFSDLLHKDEMLKVFTYFPEDKENEPVPFPTRKRNRTSQESQPTSATEEPRSFEASSSQRRPASPNEHPSAPPRRVPRLESPNTSDNQNVTGTASPGPDNLRSQNTDAESVNNIPAPQPSSNRPETNEGVVEPSDNHFQPPNNSNANVIRSHVGENDTSPNNMEIDTVQNNLTEPRSVPVTSSDRNTLDESAPRDENRNQASQAGELIPSTASPIPVVIPDAGDNQNQPGQDNSGQNRQSSSSWQDCKPGPSSQFDTTQHQDTNSQAGNSSPSLFPIIVPNRNDWSLLHEEQVTYITTHVDSQSGNNLRAFHTNMTIAAEDQLSQQGIYQIREEDPVVISLDVDLLLPIVLPALQEFKVSYLYPLNDVQEFKNYLNNIRLSDTLLFVKKHPESDLSTLWIEQLDVNLSINNLRIFKIEHSTKTLIMSRMHEDDAARLLPGLQFDETVINYHAERIALPDLLKSIPRKSLETLTLLKIRKLGNLVKFVKGCPYLRELSIDNIDQQKLNWTEGINNQELASNLPALRKIALRTFQLECSHQPAPKFRLISSYVEELYLSRCKWSLDFEDWIPLLFPKLKRVKLYVDKQDLSSVLKFLEIPTLEYLAVWEVECSQIFKKEGDNPTERKKRLTGEKSHMKRVLEEAGLPTKWLDSGKRVTFILQRDGPGRTWTGSILPKETKEEFFDLLDFQDFGWSIFYGDEILFRQMNRMIQKCNTKSE